MIQPIFMTIALTLLIGAMHQAFRDGRYDVALVFLVLAAGAVLIAIVADISEQEQASYLSGVHDAFLN